MVPVLEKALVRTLRDFIESTEKVAIWKNPVCCFFDHGAERGSALPFPHVSNLDAIAITNLFGLLFLVRSKPGGIADSQACLAEGAVFLWWEKAWHGANIRPENLSTKGVGHEVYAGGYHRLFGESQSAQRP
ncbi:MAG: hypothetical protein KMY53_17700 [Desulfarculus sp.]|nr:hypothetical protein [Pseudomonadota bacterium]MBU4576984.1 hypothetical protein [Pseudomonadota bacterium]MBU4598728.1 hypothetical protein [Pseudomonadota bacterium]MBV1717431.1 hypothetical protein [Desulfarculus sp.]MBV1740001.1 hypothetical protein [Desulfarculus sp.]